MNVLNFKKNAPLVFDAAGKCILKVHNPEDILVSQQDKEYISVGSSGVPKGKKRSAKSAPTSSRHHKKKRKLVIDDDDDEDEPLVSRDLDQSMEGLLKFILPNEIHI